MIAKNVKHDILFLRCKNYKIRTIICSVEFSVGHETCNENYKFVFYGFVLSLEKGSTELKYYYCF